MTKLRSVSVGKTGLRRIGVGLLVMAAAAAFVAGLLHTDLFDVDSIEVNGGQRLDRDTVLSTAKLSAGEPLISVDEASMERRLQANPWVESASVTSHWPGSVEVTIEERRPLLLAQTSDSRWAEIGEGGVVLSVLPTPPAGLPTALGLTVPPQPGARVDPAAEPLLATAAALPPSLQGRVSQIQHDQNGLRLGVEPDVVVILGSTESLPDKLTSAATVLGNVDPSTIDALDVTSPALPVTTPATSAGTST